MDETLFVCFRFYFDAFRFFEYIIVFDSGLPCELQLAGEQFKCFNLCVVETT